jgi:UDP-GlcNAc:undecaprenyl-phosphate/decaprenyl-phosphate GlcNAc-1-phosphate transferase
MPETGWLRPTLASLAVSVVTAFLLTPLVRNFARDRGWVDRPDGRRKLHITPVPRLGGVAVFGAFAVACATLVALQRGHIITADISASAYLHLLIACAAVAAIGVVDDIRDIRPPAKLLVQGIAALYLYFNGYQVTGISNPLTGESIELGMLSAPVTVVWFVAMSNAFNLIDGLDGLAAGVGLFSTTTLFIACAINGRWEIAVIAAALGGALLGFLRYNFNPASVFLGDSGALFIGFALAAIAVRGSMKSSAAIAMAAPLMALAVPILDASIAVFRRLVRGDDVFRADGDHIHHRLLRMGLTPRGVVGVMYAVAAAFGALSLLTMNSRGQVVGIVIIASSLVTWIGVHQLGYAEFGEIQRTLRYGVGNQRRAMGNNVYLASLAQRFAEAADMERLRATLAEAMSRLQFQRVEVLFEKGAVAPAVAAAFSTWELEPTDALHPTSTWRVPVVSDARLVATVVLTRSLGDQAQFDPGHLLTAIRNGFGSRLLALVEASPRVATRDGSAAAVNS